MYKKNLYQKQHKCSVQIRRLGVVICTLFRGLSIHKQYFMMKFNTMHFKYLSGQVENPFHILLNLFYYFCYNITFSTSLHNNYFYLTSTVIFSIPVYILFILSMRLFFIPRIEFIPQQPSFFFLIFQREFSNYCIEWTQTED